MTENQFSLSDLAARAKQGAESVALAAADAGLNVLTPERVEKLDNLKLAEKLRNAVDSGAAALRISVTDANLKDAQEKADAARAVKAEQEAKKGK